MDFSQIIKEQREELEEIEQRERIIGREGLEKTYLLAKRNKFGYINFDDERLSGIKPQDLNRILQSFYELYGDVDYIILDELQNVKKWELFANRLRRTKRVIITGSNSKLLSGELATHLTGRYIDFTLFPFSFNEFLDWKGIKKAKVYTSKEKIPEHPACNLMGL